MEEEKEFKYMANSQEHTGFLAFIDIIGFKEFIETGCDLEELYKEILFILDSVQKSLFAGHEIKIRIQSDSIIVFSPKDDDISLKIIIAGCSYILNQFLLKAISIKGTITHGEIFHASTEFGEIISGKALIDAYLFEQKQNWIGIILSPTLIRHLGKNTFDAMAESKLIIEWNNIPFKDEQSKQEERYHGFIISPLGHRKTINSREWENIEKLLKWNKLKCKSSSVQNKYENTLNFIGENAWCRLKTIVPKNRY